MMTNNTDSSKGGRLGESSGSPKQANAKLDSVLPSVKRPTLTERYIDFGYPVTYMQMWSKTKYPKWQFWHKTKYYMLVACNDKLFKLDPDTERLTQWLPAVGERTKKP